MIKTAVPKQFHLPEWAVPRDVVERLAKEDCQKEAVISYLRLNKTTKFVVASTLISTSGVHDEDPHWCWRHLTRCRTVGLGWTIEEERTLEVEERDRAEALSA